MSWVQYVESLNEVQVVALGFESYEAGLKYAASLDAANGIKPARATKKKGK